MNLEEIKKEISRAEKSLNSAKILAKNNYLEDAISRCYCRILPSDRCPDVLGTTVRILSEPVSGYAGIRKFRIIN